MQGVQECRKAFHHRDIAKTEVYIRYMKNLLLDCVVNLNMMSFSQFVQLISALRSNTILFVFPTLNVPPFSLTLHDGRHLSF